MELKYDEFIDLLNNHTISEIVFSVADYSHYSNCKICVIKDKIKLKEFYIIRCELTQDLSELVSFYETFNESYKLFDFKRKGKYTLKQIWDRVQIHSIKMRQSED